MEIHATPKKEVPGERPGECREHYQRQAHHTAGAGLALIDAPDGPAAEWIGIWRTRYNERFVSLPDGTCRKVHRAGRDWVTCASPVTYYLRSGESFDPMSSPIDLLHILGNDPSLEAMVLRLAAQRIEAGQNLTLEDEARVMLARQRLREAA